MNQIGITFGIITCPETGHYLNKLIQSIYANQISQFEILIVGQVKSLTVNSNNCRIIYFNENIKKRWITKKKNMIVQNAKYDIIVLCHDYILFDKNWYQGMVKFGTNFQVLINPIINANGKRFRDYTFFPSFLPPIYRQKCLIPYNQPALLEFNKYRYISGSYYILTKQIGLSIPLDENRVWGQGEDIIWSKQLISHNILMKFNPHSIVYLQKQKHSCSWETEMDGHLILSLISKENSKENSRENSKKKSKDKPKDKPKRKPVINKKMNKIIKK